jgi:hypothetical protein
MRKKISKYISINNYNLAHTTVVHLGKSGGTGIFVHQSLQFAPADFKNYGDTQINNTCNLKFLELLIVLYHGKTTLTKQQLR